MDVVLGAIFLLAYVSSSYKITLPFSVYWALGSAIWLIYTVDHLMDSRKGTGELSERHAFHRRYFSELIMVAGVVQALAIFNLYFLPVPIIREGALLGAICVFYLLLIWVFKSFWVKELVVATVYATAIFLPAYAMDKLSVIDILPILQLSIIALLNLCLFSYIDLEEDQRNGFGSIVTRCGNRSSLLISGLFTLALLLNIVCFMFFSGDMHLQWLYLLMTITLLIIWINLDYFRINDRYRIVGDGIFFLTIIFLAI